MDISFSLNSFETTLQLQDAIDDRFAKVKAIITCLMFAVEFVRDELYLGKHTIYQTLLTVEDFLIEIDKLDAKLNERKSV